MTCSINWPITAAFRRNVPFRSGNYYLPKLPPTTDYGSAVHVMIILRVLGGVAHNNYNTKPICLNLLALY